MKYYVTVNEQTFEIDIEQHGHISVDGVEIRADMELVGGRHLYSLLVDNASYEVVLDPETEPRNLYGIMVSGLRYLVKVQDERARRLALVDRSLRAPEGELIIKAPIPGLVVKVLAEPGQAVAAGDTVMILEAMKMENELRTPRAGIIHEVRAAPGSQVGLGQILITIK